MCAKIAENIIKGFVFMMFIVWKRSLSKDGALCDLFLPALDGRKTTTLVQDDEFFIPTKFHQNPSSGSGERLKNVKSLRQTDDTLWQ